MNRTEASNLIDILNLHNEVNMTQVGRQLDRIGLGVGDIQVGVGELNSKVSLLLASLPEQLSELRAGLEGLVGGSLGPLLPLREELAGIGAAMGEQVSV